ncbi:MAG: DUF1189 domain-containing protein [Gammaproteobacteria bacterium]|jgi:hypothetical protein
MSKYSIFQIPLLSFYSTDLYRDMALNKKGIGFGYLFLLLAFCWLIIIFALDNKIDVYLDEHSPALLNQIPEITIQNGMASIRESQPYYIDDPETGRPLAVIDTTGTINSLEQTEAVVLLTKNKVTFEKSKMETRTFELSEVGDMVIDSSLLSTWVEAAKSYMAVIMYPFALAGSFLYRIIQMLIYAAIGLVFASMLKVEPDYSQLLRLSVVAATPAILINTFLWVAGINIPMVGLIFFGMSMVYLYLGIKATIEIEPEQEAME